MAILLMEIFSTQAGSLSYFHQGPQADPHIQSFTETLKTQHIVAHTAKIS